LKKDNTFARYNVLADLVDKKDEFSAADVLAKPRPGQGPLNNPGQGNGESDIPIGRFGRTSMTRKPVRSGKFI